MSLRVRAHVGLGLPLRVLDHLHLEGATDHDDAADQQQRLQCGQTCGGRGHLGRPIDAEVHRLGIRGGAQAEFGDLRAEHGATLERGEARLQFSACLRRS